MPTNNSMGRGSRGLRYFQNLHNSKIPKTQTNV